MSCAVFESRDKIVIVMEYASRGELYDYIQERRRLPETEARVIFRQITSAVHYCHKVHTQTHTHTITCCKYTTGIQSGATCRHVLSFSAAAFSCEQANTVPLNPLNPNPAGKTWLEFFRSLWVKSALSPGCFLQSHTDTFNKHVACMSFLWPSASL